MRSILSVCFLTVITGVACTSGEQVDHASGEIRESGDESIDEGWSDADDSADEPVYERDAFVPFPRDAGWSSCAPEQDARAPEPVDAGPPACGKLVRLPETCLPYDVAYALAIERCGDASSAEIYPLPQCPDAAGEVWLTCCPGPKPRYDAGLPSDAGITPWPMPSNCSLLRLGDDHTCQDSELLERQARGACSAQNGELKSLTLLGAECSGGASAAEAVCCTSAWF